MQYDFTTLMDRHGRDAIAVDGLGSAPGFAPSAPKRFLLRPVRRLVRARPGTLRHVVLTDNTGAGFGAAKIGTAPGPCQPSKNPRQLVAKAQDSIAEAVNQGRENTMKVTA